jgi:hypothetical protein
VSDFTGDLFAAQLPKRGHLLVRVICTKANKPIAEVRSNEELGPLLWYRLNLLRSTLMSEESEPGITREQDVITVASTFAVDKIEMNEGEKIVHLVPVTRGPKTRKGRLRDLNEFQSFIPLMKAENISEWGIGCPTCGEHRPDLGDLLTQANEARASHPLKFFV